MSVTVCLWVDWASETVRQVHGAELTHGAELVHGAELTHGARRFSTLLKIRASGSEAAKLVLQEGEQYYSMMNDGRDDTFKIYRCCLHSTPLAVLCLLLLLADTV